MDIGAFGGICAVVFYRLLRQTGRPIHLSIAQDLVEQAKFQERPIGVAADGASPV